MEKKGKRGGEGIDAKKKSAITKAYRKIVSDDNGRGRTHRIKKVAQTELSLGEKGRKSARVETKVPKAPPWLATCGARRGGGWTAITKEGGVGGIIKIQDGVGYQQSDVHRENQGQEPKKIQD